MEASRTGLKMTEAVVGTNDSPVLSMIGVAALRNVQLPSCVPSMTATVNPGESRLLVLASVARVHAPAATTT